MATAQVRTCSICEDTYSEPRELPCGHYFCTKCLTGHVKSKTSDGKFKCPECPNILRAPRPANANAIRGSYPPVKPKPRVPVKRQRPKGTVSNVQVEENPLSKSIGNYLKELDGHIKKSELSFQELNSHAKEMKDEIKKAAIHMKKRIDEGEVKLVAGVDEMVKAAGEENVKREQNNHVQSITHLRTEVNGINLGNQGTDAQYQKRWDQLRAVKMSTFRYDHQQKTKTMEHLVGQLDVVKTEEELENGGGENKSNHATDIDLKAEYQVGGIVKVRDKILVVFAETPKIMVYGEDGQKIKEIEKGLPTKQLSPSAGLVHLDSTSDESVVLVIGDNDNQALHFATLTKDWEVKEHKKKTYQYHPLCVTLYRSPDGKPESNRLVVCDSDDKQIHTYRPDGTEEKAIDVDQRISIPMSAVKVEDGFVVADSNKRKVFWLSPQGSVTRECKVPEGQQIQRPWCLTVDRDTGSILVVDRSGSSVHEVDSQGNWLRVVIKKESGITTPHSIHLGHDNRLYVAYGSNERKIKIVPYRSYKAVSSASIVVQKKLSTKLTLQA